MDKFFGNYKADVVDINDPKKANRVKIRIRGLMDGIPENHLPFAKYVSQTFAGRGFGSFITPEKGSRVWVFFADGDINDPYYWGGVVEDKDDLPSAVKDGRHILFESPKKGITIAFNEKTEDIEIKTKEFNTTLNTMIKSDFGHTHIGNAAAPTSTPEISVPPGQRTSLSFKQGTL